MRPWTCYVVGAWAVAACGGGGSPDASPGDGGADSGSLIAPPDIPWLADGVPPIAIAPCRPGWREVSEDGVTTCDPYPESGPATCAFGEEHFAGEPGCRPIGEPCPSGEFAESLPTDGTVVYVSASAAAGGDGSLAAPYSTLAAVPWLSLSAGRTVAIGKGMYEGTLPLRAGVRVVGACVAETVLRGLDAPAAAVVTVTSPGEAAVLENLAIVDAPQSGVDLSGDRTLSLAGVLMERTTEYGILALGGARVTAADLVLREPQGFPGHAIHAQEGAHVEASRAVVVASRDVGIGSYMLGNVVVLTDTVVRDTEARADGTSGIGIAVSAGGRLEATGLLVAGSLATGVFATEAESEVVLADAIVRDTRGRESGGLYGRGIEIQDGASLEARRLLVAASRDEGVYVATAGARAVLEDAVVRDTDSQVSDGRFGRGIAVQRDAHVSASRVLVAESRDTGIFVGGADTDLVLTDVAVRNTQGREAELAFGYGISAQADARVSGARVLIDTSREQGLLALSNASVELDDVVVANVRRSDCTCGGRIFGYGVAAMGGAIRLTRFEVRDAATCGLFVAADPDAPAGIPSLDVESGLVTRSEIGACVQVDAYDLGRLMRGVVYEDNGTNLDSTMLPVPIPPDVDDS